MGLASYYRRFVPNFAKIAAPLHVLLKKDVVNDKNFVWSETCQSAFDALHIALMTPPVLAFPDFTKSFVLETDASILGLGAVLSQEGVDGILHPIAYASRSLGPSEKNYAIPELEVLAVVWGLKHFRPYI